MGLARGARGLVILAAVRTTGVRLTDGAAMVRRHAILDPGSRR
jgi:hypothetical protein